MKRESVCMPDNLFSVLSTYKTTENVTPEENYSTELLVYLLNYSLQKQTRLFGSFMRMLTGGVAEVELDEYIGFTVLTQKAFYTTDQRRAYPDITIESKDRIIFIEVKVESSLNYYESNDGSKDNESDGTPHYIDQIQQYQNIEYQKVKEIYLLTKYADSTNHTNCSDYTKSLLWHNFATMLSTYRTEDEVETFLIDEIVKYLEEKNMTVTKVSYELVAGMKSLKNLFRQIEMVLESEGIPYTTSVGKDWLGYYMHLDKAKRGKEAWVGNYYDGTHLAIEYIGEKAFSAIEESDQTILKLSANKNKYITEFYYEEKRYFCMKPEEQMDELKKWIKENYQRLQEYSK